MKRAANRILDSLESEIGASLYTITAYLHLAILFVATLLLKPLTICPNVKLVSLLVCNLVRR